MSHLVSHQVLMLGWNCQIQADPRSAAEMWWRNMPTSWQVDLFFMWIWNKCWLLAKENSYLSLAALSNQKYVNTEWEKFDVTPELPTTSAVLFLMCSFRDTRADKVSCQLSRLSSFFCAADLSWIPIPVYFKRVAVSFLPPQMPLRCQWTVSWCSPRSRAVAFPLFKRWVWMFFKWVSVSIETEP